MQAYKNRIFVFVMWLFLAGCWGKDTVELNDYVHFQLTEKDIFFHHKSPNSIGATTFYSKNKDESIKVTLLSVSADEINRIIKKELVLLLSHFKFTNAPYPGQLTNKVLCNKKLEPEIISRTQGQSIKYFSNERMASLVCLEKEIFYQVEMGFLYSAADKTLIKIEYFSKADSSKKSFSFDQQFKGYVLLSFK